MKLTRNKLRQLINEALKPFFMGVEPSDLLDRLRRDTGIDSQIKQLLNHPDPEMQRVGLEQVRFEPGMTEKYPELDSDEFYLDTDFVDRSQPAYKKEFEIAQSQAGDAALRRQIPTMTPEELYNALEEIAKLTFSKVFIDDPSINRYYPDMMILRGYDPKKNHRFHKMQFDKNEVKLFIDRLENLGLEDAVYIQQAHQIILELDPAIR